MQHTDATARQFILDTIPLHERDNFNIEAIADELHAAYGTWNMADVDGEAYWATVAKHAKPEDPTQMRTPALEDLFITHMKNMRSLLDTYISDGVLGQVADILTAAMNESHDSAAHKDA